jgi:hypothetical protein
VSAGCTGKFPKPYLQMVAIRLTRGSSNRFKVILLLAGSHHTLTKNPKVRSVPGKQSAGSVPGTVPNELQTQDLPLTVGECWQNA